MSSSHVSVHKFPQSFKLNLRPRLPFPVLRRGETNGSNGDGMRIGSFNPLPVLRRGETSSPAGVLGAEQVSIRSPSYDGEKPARGVESPSGEWFQSAPRLTTGRNRCLVTATGTEYYDAICADRSFPTLRKRYTLYAAIPQPIDLQVVAIFRGSSLGLSALPVRASSDNKWTFQVNRFSGPVVLRFLTCRLVQKIQS